MDSRTHIIQNTSINARFDKRENALANQQKLSAIFRDVLMDVLEDIFDEYSTDQKIVIERLEIDLQKISLENIQGIKNEFRKKLHETIRESITSNLTEEKTISKSLFEIFYFFLRKGYLPWKSHHSSFLKVTEELSNQNWDKETSNKIIKVLSLKSPRNRAFRQAHLYFLRKVYRELIYQNNTDNDANDYQMLDAETGFRHELISKLEELLENKETEIEEEIFSDLDDQINIKKDDDFIFTPYGGLVMMNPVFLRLFEKVNLLEGSDFRDEKSRERAIFILQFLVSGEEIIEEHDAAILKILVGMPLELDIPKECKLTLEEKGICIEALESVIAEWKAVKSTSVEAFRENFLIRPGNLKKSGSSFELYVQEESIDVILNFSPPPWTVGFIKLPWMEHPLTVNWF